jgi:hypothetical protein
MVRGQCNATLAKRKHTRLMNPTESRVGKMQGE